MTIAMYRRNLAIIYLLILSIGTILSLYIPKNEVTANQAVVIPNDAIRLRILANSDKKEDQDIKRMVRDEVNEEITKWVSHLQSKEEAKKVIQAGLPELQEIAETVVAEQNVNQSVKVEFGKVDFPTKLYGQFLYPAGKYEAILITLGNGVGANWWCVLFPPLCFLDFSNGVAVSDGFDGKDEEQKENDKQDKKELFNKQKENDKQDMKTFLNKQKEKADSQVYTSEDEEPVKIKFFVKEIWDKIFG